MKTLGLLIAGHIPEELSGDFPGYPEMFRSLLGGEHQGFLWSDYYVYQENFPDSPDERDAWVISGSQFSAWKEEHWMQKLGAFIRACHEKQKKILGICFGHQIIAHYLGGKCEPASGGWGIGYRKFSLTNKPPWIPVGLNEIQLSYSHQDQVTHLPPEAEVIASTNFCPIEGYNIGQHIYCVQGHPEFPMEYGRELWKLRSNLYLPNQLEAALESEPATYPHPLMVQSLRKFLHF